ncbi:MAG: HAMP domain-containing protein [Candidatus Omnitrophica bacterium]|nr:HAMP domain-containing protein [Candidatus Omnitrophota bacterium]
MAKQKRRIYFIDRKFQTQFIIKFCLLVIAGSIVTVGLLYLFASRTTTVSFENTEAVVKSTADFIIPILIQTVIIVMVVTGMFTITLTLFISHKIAGPLYRLEKEFKSMAEGDISANFQLRGNDQLQNIAASLNEMKLRLRFYLGVLQSSIDEMEQALYDNISEENKKQILLNNLHKIKNDLHRFKV